MVHLKLLLVGEDLIRSLVLLADYYLQVGFGWCGLSEDVGHSIAFLLSGLGPSYVVHLQRKTHQSHLGWNALLVTKSV